MNSASKLALAFAATSALIGGSFLVFNAGPDADEVEDDFEDLAEDVSTGDDEPADIAGADPLGADEGDGFDASRTSFELDDEDDAPPAERAPILIVGRVVDEAGQPVASAEVALSARERFDFGAMMGRGRGGERGRGRSSWRTRFRFQKSSETTRSDSKGEFRVEGKAFADSNLEVRVKHAEFAPAIASRDWKLGDGKLELEDIVLATGGRAFGVVVDEAGGPIRSAEIRYETARGRGGFGGGRGRGGDSIAELIDPVKTEENGRFELRNLPKGSFRLAATATDFIATRTDNLELEDVEAVDAGRVVLVLGAKLSGIVVDQQSRAVAKAAVEVRASFNASNIDWGALRGQNNDPQARSRMQQMFSRMRGGGQRVRVETDSAGRFKLSGLPKGNLSVNVRHPKYIDERKEPVNPDETPSVEIRVYRRLAVKGVVVDAASGQPIEVFGINARRIGGVGGEGRGQGRGRGMGFGRGERGRGMDRMRDSGRRSRRDRGGSPGRASSRRGGSQGRGQRNPRGNVPQSGAPRGGNNASQPGGRRRGNAGQPSGRRGGNRTARGSGSGNQPRRETPAQAERRKQAEARRAQRDAERARRTQQQAVRRAESEARRTQRQNQIQARLGPSGRVPGRIPEPSKHTQGRFLVEGLQPGTYVFDVGAPGYVSVAAGSFVLEREKAIPDVTIRIEQGRSISGTVVAKATNEPIAGARVELFLPRPDDTTRPQPAGGSLLMNVMRPQSPGTRLARVETDAQGRFAFAPQKPGAFHLQIRSDDYNPELVENLMLGASRDLDDLVYKLGKGARLFGRVLNKPPGETASVVIASLTGGRETLRVDPETGAYEAKGLAAGSWFVRLIRGGGGRRGGMFRQLIEAVTKPGALQPDVVLREGLEQRFDLDWTAESVGGLTGTVSVNGKPSGGISVNLRPAADNPVAEPAQGSPEARIARRVLRNVLRARTDGSGRFTLNTVPSGSYRLELSRGGGRRGPGAGRGGKPIFTQEVFVASGSAQTMHFNVLIGELNLRVKDKASGKPVKGRLMIALESEAAGRPPKEWSKLPSFQKANIGKGNVRIRDLQVASYLGVLTGGGILPKVHHFQVAMGRPASPTVLEVERRKRAQPRNPKQAPGAQPGKQGGGRAPGGTPRKGGGR